MTQVYVVTNELASIYYKELSRVVAATWGAEVDLSRYSHLMRPLYNQPSMLFRVNTFLGRERLLGAGDQARYQELARQCIQEVRLDWMKGATTKLVDYVLWKEYTRVSGRMSIRLQPSHLTESGRACWYRAIQLVGNNNPRWSGASKTGIYMKWAPFKRPGTWSFRHQDVRTDLLIFLDWLQEKGMADGGEVVIGPDRRGQGMYLSLYIKG